MVRGLGYMGRSTALLPPLLWVLAVSGSMARAADAVSIRIGVDWNGDGLIRTRAVDRAPVDAPTPAQPYTHWINHDQEALKLGLQAEEALLQVGAIPAGAYDTREVLTLPDMAEVETPWLAERGGYFGYIESTRTPAYMPCTTSPTSCSSVGTWRRSA